MEKEPLISTNHMDKNSTDLLNVPEPKNLFSEAFSNSSDYINLKTAGAAVGIAALGTAAVLGARALPRFFSSAAAAGENAALKGTDAAATEALVAEAGKRAAVGTVTLEGKAIPNVAREGIESNALNSEQAFQNLKLTGAERYAEDLLKIPKYVPLQQEIQMASKLSSVADSSIALRSILTKERTGPEQLAKEIERLSGLNTGLAINDGMLAAGSTIRLADDAFLKKVSDDLIFKHVPPIGQFMKGTGKITEEQISKALEIQKTMAPDAQRKLLGQVLVDNKLALQADVDLAFARQTEMKAALQKIRDAGLDALLKK